MRGVTTSYEVRTLKDGRWLTEYRSDDERAAVAHAKVLYQGKRYKGIKVIKETFFEDKGTFKERVVYNFMKRQEPPVPESRPSNAYVSSYPRQQGQRATIWAKIRALID